MATWSSYTESLYRALIYKHGPSSGYDNEENNRIGILSRILETTPLDIGVDYEVPSTEGHVTKSMEKLSDSLNMGGIYEAEYCLLDCPDGSSSTVIHRTTGSTSVRRINAFYSSYGDSCNSIYSLPYESTQYSSANMSKRKKRGTPKNWFYRTLEHEIINSMDVFYVSDVKNSGKTSAVVVKPCGALNGGIEGIRLSADLLEERIEIECKTIFKVYPSCNFYKNNSERRSSYMYPYTNSKEIFPVSCGWHGFSLKQSNLCTGTDDYVDKGDLPVKKSCKYCDILEIKTSNKSLYSCTVYARNINGIFVGMYSNTNDWKMVPLNNVPYSDNDRIYFMEVSPFISGECAMLKSHNGLLLYDVSTCREREIIDLYSFKGLHDYEYDIVQTICYGMDTNNIILGGNRLYNLDLRSRNLDGLVLRSKPSITVTGTKWTERHYGSSQFASKHFMHSLCGPSCAISNYWRISKPSFWAAFTACKTHPIHSFLLASIYGTSNCIYVFDLRIPTAPILEIPLPSNELIGARFRHLDWSLPNDKHGDTILIAFCWRQRNPISCRFKINESFTEFSEVCTDILDQDEKTSSNGRNFAENDMHITFRNCRPLNLGNVDEMKEQHDFESIGPLFETSIDFLQQPLHFPQESALSNIFHGYLGIAIANIFAQNSMHCKLLLGFTTSGKLLCLNVDGDKEIFVKRDVLNLGIDLGKGVPEVDLMEDDIDVVESGFEGFKCTCESAKDLDLPPEMIFDRLVKRVKVKGSLSISKMSFEGDIISLNLPQLFVNFQEGVIGGFTGSSAAIPNCSLCSDMNTVQFDSKMILKSLLLDFKRARGNYNNDTSSIMSLAKFEDKFGSRELLERLAENIWDCNDLRIDYDYDSECNTYNNPLLTPTYSCCCNLVQDGSSLEEYNSRILKKMLTRCQATLGLVEQTATTHDEYVANRNPAKTMQQILNHIDSLKIEIPYSNRGLIKTIGNHILFHSPVLPQYKGDHSITQSAKDPNTYLHKEYCGINQLISVKLKTQTSDPDSDQKSKEKETVKKTIKKLLSMWKVVGATSEDKTQVSIVFSEYKTSLYEQNTIGSGIRRFYRPCNQIELLKTSKIEQDRLISQLLEIANYRECQ